MMLDFFHTGQRGRPERSDTSKLEILDYWEERGIRAAEEHFGLRERTLRRYIAEARRTRGW